METTSYTINEIELKSQPEEYLHKICDFWDLTFRWVEKDDPLPDRDQRLHNIRNPHPHGTSFQWVVTNPEGTIIALADMGFQNEQNPGYEQNKHSSGGYIEVLPEYRRRGIGTELLKKMASKAREHNKTILQTGAELETGFNFMEQFLGGVSNMKGAENRVRIADIDWDLMGSWVSEGEKKNPDTELVFFENCPDDIIEEYMKTYTATMNQQPMGDLEWKYEGTPEVRRLDEKRRQEEKVNWYTLATKEQDGHISGLTEFFFNTTRTFRIGQNLTGVNEADRGRGLGKWLKAELLTRVMKMHPEIIYISTGNADTNAPMLSINNRMGFKQHKVWQAYKFTIEDLMMKLN